jgi:hypothetical protein
VVDQVFVEEDAQVLVGHLHHLLREDLFVDWPALSGGCNVTSLQKVIKMETDQVMVRGFKQDVVGGHHLLVV